MSKRENKPRIKLVDRFGDNVTPLLLNTSYGGFSLDKQTIIAIQDLFNNKSKGEFDYYEVKRHDEDLISTVVKGGLRESSGSCCVLSIEYIPSEFLEFYYIDEYDGFESIKLDYSKYLMTKLDLITNNKELSSEQKIEEINKLRFYVKRIQEIWVSEWSPNSMFSNP